MSTVTLNSHQTDLFHSAVVTSFRIVGLSEHLDSVRQALDTTNYAQYILPRGHFFLPQPKGEATGTEMFSLMGCFQHAFVRMGLDLKVEVTLEPNEVSRKDEFKIAWY